MAKKFADLHVHTRASDGGMLAEEVVRQAREVGLLLQHGCYDIGQGVGFEE